MICRILSITSLLEVIIVIFAAAFAVLVIIKIINCKPG